MKIRLDILLTEKALVKSRNVASTLIKEGQVLVNGQIVKKMAELVDREAELQILTPPAYVGRGGLKLEKALVEFKINPAGLICLDVGASTGGFTDCLLQNGAKKVYAVDVGTDQFDSELKKNPQVILQEQTDIRSIEKLRDKIDLAVIDVSFISLELILPTVKKLLTKNGEIVALIKPQFETEKRAKNKRGVLKNTDIRQQVLMKIQQNCADIGLQIKGLIESPILGGSGNKEYLLFLSLPNP